MNKKKVKFFTKEFLTKKIFEKNLDISKNQYNYSPLISVVIPSFNQAKYIEKSILSVLNQDYPNKELIIIDGGSNDGTVEILKKYDGYIKYWISENDKGQSDALNKGFKVCSGDIYAWLNSDDLFLPNAFSYAVKELSKKNKKICYGDWVYIDENDEKNQYKKIEIIIDRGPKKHRNINKTYATPTKFGIHLNTIAIKIIKLTKEDFLSVFFILRFFSKVHLFRHVLNTKKHV